MDDIQNVVIVFVDIKFQTQCINNEHLGNNNMWMYRVDQESYNHKNVFKITNLH